jgi:hypothetical protein
MIGKLRVIESDVYDICSRIREIDPAYFIVRNYRRKRFELHAHGQRGGTLALVLPYDRLDARVLVLARRTRAERKEQLLAEAKRDNERLERRGVADVVAGAIKGSYH